MSEDTSLINRFPAETLAEIFFFVQPEGVLITDMEPERLEEDTIHGNPGYPWILSLVCRLWRDITFTTPRLWGSISIYLGPPGYGEVTTNYVALLARFQMGLNRSREYPLTLHVKTLWRGPLAALLFITECFQYTLRWRDVAFDASNELLSDLSDPSLQYPQLRSFRLIGDGMHKVSNSHGKLLANAPLLCELGLYNVPCRMTELRFPWLQITHFTIESGKDVVNKLFCVLRAMPKLVSLRFHQLNSLGSDRQAIESFNRPLELAHLRKLSWSTHTHNYLVFFNSTRAPRLTEIEIDCDQDEEATWVGPVEEFFHQSNCTITSIRLNRVSGHVASLLLTTLPDVETVDTSLTTMDKTLLRYLTFDDLESQRRPCPRIERITLDTSTAPTIMWEEFATMVESRLRVHCGELGGCRLELLGIKPAYVKQQWIPGYVTLVAQFDRLPGES